MFINYKEKTIKLIFNNILKFIYFYININTLLNSSLNITEIELEYSNIFSQNYKINISKFGKVCIANLLFLNTSTIPQSTNILNDVIPNEFRPYRANFGAITNIDKTVTFPIIVDFDGTVKIPNYPVTQQAYYYGQIVWLTR